MVVLPNQTCNVLVGGVPKPKAFVLCTGFFGVHHTGVSICQRSFLLRFFEVGVICLTNKLSHLFVGCVGVPGVSQEFLSLIKGNKARCDVCFDVFLSIYLFDLTRQGQCLSVGHVGVAQVPHHLLGFVYRGCQRVKLLTCIGDSSYFVFLPDKLGSFFVANRITFGSGGGFYLVDVKHARVNVFFHRSGKVRVLGSTHQRIDIRVRGNKVSTFEHRRTSFCRAGVVHIVLCIE